MERVSEVGGRPEGERTPRSIVVLFVIVVVGAAVYWTSRYQARRLAERTPIPSAWEAKDDLRYEKALRWTDIASDLAWEADAWIEPVEVALQCAPAELMLGQLTLGATSPCMDIGDPPWAERAAGGRAWTIVNRRRPSAGAMSPPIPQSGLPRPVRPPHGPRRSWRASIELAELRNRGPLPETRDWDGGRACDEATWRAADHEVTLMVCDPQHLRRKDFYDEFPIIVTASGAPCAIAAWLQDCGRPPGLARVGGVKVAPCSDGVIAAFTMVTFARRED